MEEKMNSLKKTARVAGILYIIMRVGPVRTHPACIGALRAKKRGQSID